MRYINIMSPKGSPQQLTIINQVSGKILAYKVSSTLRYFSVNGILYKKVTIILFLISLKCVPITIPSKYVTSGKYLLILTKMLTIISW